MDSLLKWAGGKKTLVDTYKGYHLFKKKSFLVEPFLGGGGSFLNLKSDYAAGCDTNKSLIYLWQMVRDNHGELVSWYDYYHGIHTPGSYDCARKIYNDFITDPSLDKAFVSVEKKTDIAGVFLYLMKTCFNGLCRYNKKGEYNVPIGDKLPTVEAIREKLLIISDKIQGCSFHHWDFDTTINFYKKNCNVFIYCDPPYSRTAGGKEFQDYTGQWKPTDADRLAQTLLSSGVDFAVSEADTPEVRERYKNCYKVEISANRSIGGNRQKAKELLILSRL